MDVRAPFVLLDRFRISYGGLLLFNYMAAADQGERLGVPGFEGTLIFLALLQVPAVLFQRKPDLID